MSYTQMAQLDVLNAVRVIQSESDYNIVPNLQKTKDLAQSSHKITI